MVSMRMLSGRMLEKITRDRDGLETNPSIRIAELSSFNRTELVPRK
jgi:hypothetical protein